MEEIANKYQEAYLWGQENQENSGETPTGWHKRQRDKFQQERLDIEKAMGASLEGEKRKLERIRKENLAELGQQGLLKELKEKQQ